MGRCVVKAGDITARLIAATVWEMVHGLRKPGLVCGVVIQKVDP